MTWICYSQEITQTANQIQNRSSECELSKTEP